MAQLASDPGGSAAAEVLARLLGNVAAAPGEPKFRRLRLSNPRIQAEVLEAQGGLELLTVCGFEFVFEDAPAAAGGPDAAADAAAATEG